MISEALREFEREERNRCAAVAGEVFIAIGGYSVFEDVLGGVGKAVDVVVGEDTVEVEKVVVVLVEEDEE